MRHNEMIDIQKIGSAREIRRFLRQPSSYPGLKRVTVRRRLVSENVDGGGG